MKSTARVLALGVCLLSVVAAGCRQPEGPIPTKAGEDVNKAEDLARDFKNVSHGASGSPQELSDDLGAMTDGVPQPLVAGLDKALQTALTGRQLQDQPAQQLADAIFIVIKARAFTERQIEKTRGDVSAAVRATGAPAAAEAAVADASAALMKSRMHQRRWYEVF